MHKKLISTITLGLIVGATTVNSFAANTEFTDISGHWGESQIQAFVNKGYINGYPDGTFKPNKSITRAEFVKIFNTTFGLTSNSGKVFNDTVNHWAKNEIDIAVTNGVCNGMSVTEFAPDQPITREQAAKMIANYKKIKDTNYDIIYSYVDGNQTSSWAINEVEAILEAGYMNGYAENNTFKPKNNITRAEAVSTLSRVNNDKLNSIVVNSIKELQKALLDKNIDEVIIEKNIGTIENIYVPKNKTLTIKSELDIYTANIDGNLNLDNCGATNFYKDVNINGNLNVYNSMIILFEKANMNINGNTYLDFSVIDSNGTININGQLTIENTRLMPEYDCGIASTGTLTLKSNPIVKNGELKIYIEGDSTKLYGVDNVKEGYYLYKDNKWIYV